MQQESTKGLFFQIPANHLHGGHPLSSKPQLSLPHQLNTSLLHDQIEPPVSLYQHHHHHPQPHMTPANLQSFFSNAQRTSLSTAIPHDLSSSPEASSLSLSSAHGLSNFNNIMEAKQPPEEQNELDIIVNERRVRRLISNRESARRSRMRKRKQLEELQGQVKQLLAANHQLTEKLNQVLECNYRVIQENSLLKDEASSLRMVVTDLIMSVEDNRHHVSPQTDEEVEAREMGDNCHGGGGEVVRNMVQARTNRTANGAVDVVP